MLRIWFNLLFGNRTPYYALIILVGGFLLLNIVLSFPVVQAQLPPQHYGSEYPDFEYQLDGLNKLLAEKGHVDCIFLGSSMTRNGMYPAEFEEGYRQQTGEDITCFNLSLWGLTASSAGPLAEAVASKFHPRLLVYATAARDYDQVGFIPGEYSFPQTAWVRYREGDVNLEGWLTDKSKLVRYYHALHNWVFPAVQDYSTFILARPSQGFSPIIEQNPSFRQTLLDGYDVNAEDCCEYRLTDADLEGLRQILGLADDSLSILIYEAPIHPLAVPRIGHNGDGQQLFLDTVREEASQRGIPFWETSYLSLIPDADWKDFLHPRITGAIQFSRWMGMQVGEAVNQGLLDDPVPEPLLREVPLPDLKFETPYYLDTWGMFPDTYQEFLDYQYDLTPSDAVIFNPSTGLDSRSELQMELGFFIDWAQEVDPSMHANLFDFFTVLDRMRYGDELTLDESEQQALDQWRQSKQASDLAAAGIDYLIYSDEWLSFTSEAEAAPLADTSQYELVATWQHRVSTRQFWLYRVVASDPGR